MIRARGLTIGGLMGVTFMAAIGLAALRNASETWAGIVFALTCGVLICATVATVCRPVTERPWWLGFTLFGCGYLMLVYRYDQWHGQFPLLPTSRALLAVMPLFGAHLPTGFPVPAYDAWSAVPFLEIGQCLSALLVASVGGLATFGICAWARRPTAAPAPVQNEPVEIEPTRWHGPGALTLGGAGLILTLTLAGYPRGPDSLAGVAYLLTAALVTTAVLGALLSHGRRRAAWLGAAFFGGCYLAFQVSVTNATLDGKPWPHCQAMDHVLRPARHWLVSGVKVLHGTAFVTDTENVRIRQKLEQRVAMRFPNATPLEDVLAYIQVATEGPGGVKIPIYVDPVGLQEAEKTMTSPVQLDLEGLPVRVTLPLVLKQLGLTCHVRDGLLFITSAMEYDVARAVFDDPYLLIVHCILTCLVSALGSVLGPLVAEVKPTDGVRRPSV